jgi:DNA invertase Pin-like site-specific DNA recombinase/predicted DNA-binding transcriptional regulator AlpA
MGASELVTSNHLSRKAVIYVRQSTPHQVISHQESLRIQYALKDRAVNLGWRAEDVEIIDTDLGLSATTVNHREGFKTLLGRVTLGEIGIILSCEVTRLCRNCSDWYPLLDVCGYKGCLIADNDGVYDPASPNGRLLLGLKGQISELELHTLRSRLNAGILNKAQRGELCLKLPVGLIRDAHNSVVKDPHQEVQQRLDMIFSTFLRLKAAVKVLQYFNNHSLDIPRRNSYGDLIWKKPTLSAILSVLKNPAYAGAFVYGRRKSLQQTTPSGKTTQRLLSMDQWKIIVKDKYPAYITWETFEKIQAILYDNYLEYDRNKSRGVPRQGAALLHGILYCGQCGHKMVVQYKHSTRYICNYLRQQYRVPVCQYIPADPVDAHVVEAFFEALSPAEIDAYSQALEKQKQMEEQLEQAHLKQIQRLRYQAALAQRQFDQVDPDNRLVASELERRWESALRELKQAEQGYEAKKNLKSIPSLPGELKEIFTTVGQTLPQIWDTAILSNAQKKALLRSLIDKVVIHRITRDKVQTRIVWKGEATTTMVIPITVGSFAELSCAKEMEDTIVQLAAQGVSDEEISQQLTDKGHRSPLRNHVLPSTVRTIRLKHRLLRKTSQSHPRRIPGYLTVPQVAQRLGIESHWIYDRIHKGCIEVVKDPETELYLFPDKHATIEMLNKLKNGQIHKLHF